MSVDNEKVEMSDKTGKKDNKIIVLVIAVLLLITAAAAWWYLRDRTETPENALIIVSGGKETAVDLTILDPSPFSGEVVNGKGEKKEIDAEGVKLSEVIGTTDYSEVSVTSDDEYSVTVKKDEIDNAWLKIEGNEAGLVVFGDENSKRNVKNVVRIEVK